MTNEQQIQNLLKEDLYLSSDNETIAKNQVVYKKQYVSQAKLGISLNIFRKVKMYSK